MLMLFYCLLCCGLVNLIWLVRIYCVYYSELCFVYVLSCFGVFGFIMFYRVLLCFVVILFFLFFAFFYHVLLYVL